MMGGTLNVSAVLLSLLLYSEAPEERVREVAAREPVHYIVGVDRSASRSQQEMRDMRRFMERLAAQLDFGDALSIVQVFQSRIDRVIEFRDSIPLPQVTSQPLRREIALRDALRQSFAQAGRKFTDTTGMKAIQTTDILGFLRRASDYSRGGGGRKVIVIVLSDMLHSTPRLSFERTADIPNSMWIAAQHRDRMLSSLDGACIVAVGAEEGSPRAVRVRDFWSAYFQTTGGVLKDRNYRAYLEPRDMDCVK